ncbi:MAG: DNA repair exonuclease [Geminicoccaceae bacterium]|nr:DNA repair exonuclease [Geminicoccaceae bacterium]
MVRFLHSSDWHLGCPYRQIPGDAGALLRERRLEAVREIAALARACAVDAVLVAGDVFDRQHVEEDLLRRTLEALAGFPGPWIFLPGNHDAALPESVWTRLERTRAGSSAELRVAARPEPIAIAEGRAWVLPAPLHARRTLADLSTWMDEAETPPGAIRIGLAHGLVEGLMPNGNEALNPIARDRAERARLEYLALGDRHALLEVDPRTWYSGTPEPDHYRYREAGYVLLVEIDGPGALPRIEPIATARYVWEERELDFPPQGPDELAARIAGLEHALPGSLERIVLRLTLSGAVDLRGRQAVDDALASLRAKLRHLELKDRLQLQPSEPDLARLDDGGLVGACARSLQERILRAPDEEERAVAALALRLLWREVEGLGTATERPG